MVRIVPKEDLPMLPQKLAPEPAWAVFDQFGDDRAAERERCRRRRDQSIVVLTQRRAALGRMVELRPLCEASHATPFQAMITCRPERDTGSWVPDEAAHKATQFLSRSIGRWAESGGPRSLRELADCFE